MTKDEWQKLRDMINAWPDDSDRIRMHRVINRLYDEPAEAFRSTCARCGLTGQAHLSGEPGACRAFTMRTIEDAAAQSMTSEELAELRSFAASGDRDARIELDCGKLIRLIDSGDRLARQLERCAPILDVAIRIGMHWHDQAGVNGALLDELARLVTEQA